MCFDDLCNEFALLFALECEGDEDMYRANAERVVGAFKTRSLLVPVDATESIERIVNLPDLYKVSQCF